MIGRVWPASTRATRSVARALAQLNARHPWSHNDHFHPWVLTRLPRGQRTAIDVGCGRGELVAALSPHFERVVGTDVDADMRRVAGARCAGLPNVTIADTPLEQMQGPVDLVTMIAVLHHLDIPTALEHIRRLLAPGGAFLAVGLAPAVTPRDHLWDAASAATNPLIGWVKHPWSATAPPAPDPYPTADPTTPFDELRGLVRSALPGATMRRHLGFRHPIEWRRPD